LTYAWAPRDLLLEFRAANAELGCDLVRIGGEPEGEPGDGRSNETGEA
jgi:hypothetical protein